MRQALVNFGHLTLDQWWLHAAWLCEGVVRLNMGVDTSSRAPLRYVEHSAVDLGPFGLAWPIQTANRLFETGEGNCLDLAGLLASRLRKIGHPAQIEVRVNPNRRDGHAFVVVGGNRLDPVRMLHDGML